MVSFITKFFRSKILRHLIIAGLLVVIVVFAVSIYLKSYTNHGQKIFTPSFAGLTIDEANDLATEKEIHISIIDSVYDAYGDPGTVVDQTPKSNFMVKKGRTIFIVVKAKSLKIVTMPNLRSISLIQARSEIESNGLKIGHIKYQPSDYNDLVIEQLVNGEIIEIGTSIPAGTKINLIVGQKRGTEAVVPNLIGLTADKSSFKAAEYSLNIGDINFDESVETSQDRALAVIYKQSIRQDYIVEYGTEIDIWLTVEPENYND